MDAISVLKQDHQTVEALFKRYEKLGDGAHVEKRRVVEQVLRELSIHAVIEEQFLYPLVREREPRMEKIALNSLEEHHVVKWVLAELEKRAPEHERFDAKMHVLMENVREHVREEEEELFPLMQRLMAKEELEALGDALLKAKPMAPTRPHPRAPDHPPANMVAGMFSKVLDTGVDAIKTVRRKTFAAAAKRVRRK